MGQVQLTRFVPPRHPWWACASTWTTCCAATPPCWSGPSRSWRCTDAAVLCRAFILQLLYPVGSRRYFPGADRLQPAVPLVRRPDAGAGRRRGGRPGPGAGPDRPAPGDRAGAAPGAGRRLADAAELGSAQAAARSPAGTGQRPLARGVAGYAANAAWPARVDAVASRSRPTDSIGMTVTPARRPPASGDVRACLSDFLVANYARLIGRLRAAWAAKTWLPTACTTPGCAWRMGRRRSRWRGGRRQPRRLPVPHGLQHRHRPPARRAVAARGRSRARTGRGRGRRARPAADRAGAFLIARLPSEVDTLPRQQRAVYIDVRIEGLPQSAAASR